MNKPINANAEEAAAAEDAASVDFIRTIINADNDVGKHDGRVQTRFPPEPNGYLHLGHAKSICLNFGIGQDYRGKTNLRFDDTNPVKEDVEYVDSIQEDVRWLGFDWEDRLFYASDNFERLYGYAEALIEKGKAYVDSLPANQIREYRGTLTEPGQASPHRDRSVEENLDMFRRMRAGEFTDGAHVLRAKIDMASPNMLMRDPTLYRIRTVHHHRTGDQWCIYPMYDFAHCLSDSIEGITHSICTLEFENNRPLYDWILDQLDVFHPQQIEFARLNLTHTVLSKRKLIQLVAGGHVGGWDDPRMPTISGQRRRGVPPEAIRNFCDRIGVAKRDSTVDMALYDHCTREVLNDTTPRVMGVLRPLKVVIENYPEGQTEMLTFANHPTDPSMGTREVPFSREIFVEQDDYRHEAPRKWFRLTPGREVRLRYAYLITCREAITDPDTGELIELRCTYDPDTRGGNAPDGRKVKGTLHWVSANHGIPAEVRLYEHLFTDENPGALSDDALVAAINPDSFSILSDCRVEPGLADAKAGQRFQFERMGYFAMDPDSTSGRPVFNRTATLRDTWAKMVRTGKAGGK